MSLGLPARRRLLIQLPRTGPVRIRGRGFWAGPRGMVVAVLTVLLVIALIALILPFFLKGLSRFKAVED